MGKLFEFGRTLGYHKVPFAIISRAPLLPHDKDCRVSSLWSNHSWSFDALNLPIPPPPPSFKALFTVFLWHVLLGLLTLSYGPTIRVLVLLNLPLNFSVNSN